MGPLVSSEQADRVLGFIETAVHDGGALVAGGHRPSEAPLQAGHFVQPTVIDRVPTTSRAYQEEIFGPVLSVTSFTDVEEAVRAANGTRFGLFAALWTRDLATAHTFARRLHAGMVSVNEPPNTFPQTPFGGVKESGLGFEQGRRAIEFYTRTKNVMVNVALPRKKG
jgi:aldehyde dehydrogenase (NAD+)